MTRNPGFPSVCLRRAMAALLLGAVAAGLFAACTTAAIPPTYTQDELRVICERRGGWWRGDLIAGYCEYQAAFLAP